MALPAFDYLRRGTPGLSATVAVTTGPVLAPTGQATRTATDLVRPGAPPGATAPSAGCVFGVDHRNRHPSQGLLRYGAKPGGRAADRGRQGQRGLLTSRATRPAFLKEKEQRRRFGSVPKPPSGLTQVASGFSILGRRVRRRGNLRRTQDRRQRSWACLAYVKRVVAKPLPWTSSGRPLNV